MPDDSATCQSTCEMNNMHTNPTQEITLNMVFRAIGNLEGTVSGLGDKIEDIQEQQTEFDRKLGNISVVAQQPHKCNNETLISTMETDIKDLQATKNKVLGGKAVLLIVIMLISTMVGSAFGAYATYKIQESIKQSEEKTSGENR